MLNSDNKILNPVLFNNSSSMYRKEAPRSPTPISYLVWFLENFIPLLTCSAIYSRSGKWFLAPPPLFRLASIYTTRVKISKPYFLNKVLKEVQCFRLRISAFFFRCYLILHCYWLAPPITYSIPFVEPPLCCF